MPLQYFVAGTDTGVGKTLVSVALLQAANAKGLSTAALKPIAAGCEYSPEGLRNEDALMLQQAMSVELAYEQVNPVALEPPMAPHVAAGQVNKRITADRLAGFCRGVLMQRTDFVVVEGAGGWRVPLNERETLAALPKLLNLPVVLVVGMRLGCLNHALLTAEAIARDGLPLAGWIANTIDPEMPALEECIQTLEQTLPAPLLGHIPFLNNPDEIDSQTALDIDKLLG